MPVGSLERIDAILSGFAPLFGNPSLWHTTIRLIAQSGVVQCGDFAVGRGTTQAAQTSSLRSGTILDGRLEPTAIPRSGSHYTL